MIGEQTWETETGQTRLAAIDIGSNSIRLVVAHVLTGGQFRIVDEEREATRLVRHLGSTGRLDDEAIDKTIAGLKRFSQLAHGQGVSQMKTIATCAVREADNGAEFVQRVRDETGLEVTVITAQDEARYAFRSVQGAFDITDRNIAVVDIGGGSTELVYASAGHVEKICSTPLGSVRLTELCGGSLFGDEPEKLVSYIDRELKRRVRKRPFAPSIVFGTGGTFTALASMIIAARKEDSQMIWGYRVTRADVRHVFYRLANMSPKERRNVPGLSTDRADIIVAGLAIIDRVMARLKTNVLRVHTGGVRDGLLLSMVNELPGTQRQEPDSRLAIESFAVSCGADLPHSKHVAWLAGELCEQLGDKLPLEPGDREILETAALLQDVGYLINYKQHHQHSYQLIVNSRLPGFRREELELIANVARYHRGARPKKKHASFRQLHRADRQRVVRLASLLRISGALDRGHAQRVCRLQATVDQGRVTIGVAANGDPALELWAARQSAEFFQRAFRRDLQISWINQTEESHSSKMHVVAQDAV